MSFGDTFPGFRLRPTSWGLVYLAGLLVLGFAAVNTGNNALMAVFALGLGSYVVSGAWSRQVLADVEVRAELPRELFAGRPAVVELELVNRSRYLPAYGVAVLDSSGRRLAVERLLAPTGRRRHAVEITFPGRGWVELGPWRLEVLLPLGFFAKTKRVLGGRRVLVYPALVADGRAAVRWAGRDRVGTGAGLRGRVGEVVQLRDYREDDDRRQLHWKQTARQQRPIVVDRRSQAARQVYLVLDPRLSDPADPELIERFERAVSEVTTVVVRTLREGAAVGLVVGSTVVHPARSPAERGRLLRPLAEVQPLPKDAPPPTVAAGHEVGRWRVETGG